jgi:hypothetical protein
MPEMSLLNLDEQTLLAVTGRSVRCQEPTFAWPAIRSKRSRLVVIP